VLSSAKATVERKVFTFELRQNQQGRFVKIVEDVGGRRDAICIPVSGLNSFLVALTAIMSANDQAGPPPELLDVTSRKTGKDAVGGK
jgi:hypothetical protein